MRLPLTSLLIALGLAAALPIAGPVSAADSMDDSMDDDDDDFIGEEAYVKLELSHGGKTRKHPGYVAVTDEEMILSMGSGDSAQEVSILLTHGEGDTWNATVRYSVGGTAVVTGKQDIRTKKWIAFKSEDGKSSLKLHVEPGGKGGEDIDLGKGNKPLDGLE